MGSFSGQFSRPLPGPPWSGENGVGLARVHAVSSLVRSARELVWPGAVVSGTVDCCLEHVTQTLLSSLDGSLPGGPFLSISKREGSRSWIFYMTVVRGWMYPRKTSRHACAARELGPTSATPRYARSPRPPTRCCSCGTG